MFTIDAHPGAGSPGSVVAPLVSNANVAGSVVTAIADAKLSFAGGGVTPNDTITYPNGMPALA